MCFFKRLISSLGLNIWVPIHSISVLNILIINAKYVFINSYSRVIRYNVYIIIASTQTNIRTWFQESYIPGVCRSSSCLEALRPLRYVFFLNSTIFQCTSHMHSCKWFYWEGCTSNAHIDIWALKDTIYHEWWDHGYNDNPFRCVRSITI